MPITCSRCQADNNDIKYACWNCWAVLPRPLTEEELLLLSTKGKNNKTVPAVVIDNSSDVTQIIPLQPEQKKSGLFGKKKTVETVTRIEEIPDVLVPLEETIIDTTSEPEQKKAGLFGGIGKKKVVKPVTTTEEAAEIFVPLEEKNIEIAPEPAKEKKSLFGFGKKKTEEPAPVVVTEVATPAPTPVPVDTSFDFDIKKADDVIAQTPPEKDAGEQKKIARKRPTHETGDNIKLPKKPT